MRFIKVLPRNPWWWLSTFLPRSLTTTHSASPSKSTGRTVLNLTGGFDSSFYDDYYDGGNFNFDNFRYGYDTGVGYNRQFKYEERDNYGVLHGRWVWFFSSSYLKILWRRRWFFFFLFYNITESFTVVLMVVLWFWFWFGGEDCVKKIFRANKQYFIREKDSLSRFSIWINRKIDYPKPKWKYFGHVWRACNKSISFARLNWWLRPVTNCDWEQLTNANS